MYQRMVFQTGNQDLCYYNFFCAHPLGPLADFNHVYSNIGYVLLGIAFMAQVRIRQVAQRKKQGAELGIPLHHGIFYWMGLALSMEGILSACYHLCPNKMNFQFDSSFMYVLAVLCMIKLYQNRVCLYIFDSHDLWHAASAAALYLSFNMLLTIDDPLADTLRELIPVF
ncbi:SID1 transmembrane family member 1-like [Cydia amplana]|uniref:SID1 transmembrane family member 1-like n=1 Tax=Cydia amplana TaxID=1869771 RepID=UPI002FE6C24F